MILLKLNTTLFSYYDSLGFEKNICINRIHRIQQYEKRKIRNLKVKTFLRYYGVSSLAVDWTAMAFMAYYLIFIFPATYMVNRWGLRWSNIIGCCVTCLGSWIKVLSVSPDRFWVTFIGQSLVASTQVRFHSFQKQIIMFIQFIL